MQHLLFVDMDGVLVDLVTGLNERLGMQLTYERSEEFNAEFKNLMARLNYAEKAQFFAKLPPKPEMERLWNRVKFYKPLILTSASNSEAVAYGKQLWILTHLGIDSSRVFCVSKSKDKQNFACKNSMLIDDFDQNIEQFRAAGGQAIHHVDIEKTLTEFDEWVSKTWKYDNAKV